MADPRFFARNTPLRLGDIAEMTGALLAEGEGAFAIEDVAPLDRSDRQKISFLDNPKYIDSFAESKAGACFVKERYRDRAPKGMALLLTEDPYRAYARIAQHFYPFIPQVDGISPHAVVEPSATIGKDTTIGPGAFIGKHVEIGERVIIGPNAVLHEGVSVGHDSRIGAISSLSHCLIGERVIIHRGVHIGQDGFGFALHRDGHMKVPQLGRVIVGNDVEIGAGTCIDRGTGPDTTIGDGAKIDNLVQIGHNVQIGRGAIVVAQVGISGSTRIGDGAVLGGQVGIAGHLRIGPGAKIAAQAGVMADIPAGESYGGSPAVPVKDWHRQTVALARLIRRKKEQA